MLKARIASTQSSSQNQSLKFLRVVLFCSLVGLFLIGCGQIKSESQKETEEIALSSVPPSDKLIRFLYPVKDHGCEFFENDPIIERCFKLEPDSGLRIFDNAYLKVSDENRAVLLHALESEGWLSLQKPFSIKSSLIGIKDKRLFDEELGQASVEDSVLSIGVFYVERARIQSWRRGKVVCAPQVEVSVKLKLTEAGLLYDARDGELLSAFRVCFGADNVGITPRVTPVWR